LLLRADNAAALERVVDALGPSVLEQAIALRWPAEQALPEALSQRCAGLPIDLWLADPSRHYSRLYQHARLHERHPARLSMPAVAGAEAAIRVAAALHLPAQLYIAPADAATLAEIGRILDFYLNHAGVDQPVEPFHSLLLGFLRESPPDLWGLQEADSSQSRWVDAHGLESAPGRLRGMAVEESIRLAQGLRDHADCRACAYQPACQGFFKWPDPAYDCAGWLTLWTRLRQAAQELRADLANAEETHGA
jgi:hypothetical protein